MFVTVEGFGSIWSQRRRRDPHDPAREQVAYYNTTGIPVDGTLRHRSRVFGQLRFHAAGGFHPNAVERNIGRVFHGASDWRDRGPCLTLHHGATELAATDYFLFAVTSDRTGTLSVESDGWKSDGVVLLSCSQFGPRQEILLLMPAYSWIRGALGRFEAEPVVDRRWRGFLRLMGD